MKNGIIQKLAKFGITVGVVSGLVFAGATAKNLVDANNLDQEQQKLYEQLSTSEHYMDYVEAYKSEMNKSYIEGKIDKDQLDWKLENAETINFARDNIDNVKEDEIVSAMQENFDKQESAQSKVLGSGLGMAGSIMFAGLMGINLEKKKEQIAEEEMEF